MNRRGVNDSLHCIQAQGVHVIVPHPHDRIVDEEPAHLVAARPVEIHGAAPGGRIPVGEIGPETAQVVALGAEVIVDHIENHGEPLLVASVHQPFELHGAAVWLVGGVDVHSVVAPSPSAREAVYRHELDMGYAQVDEIIQLFCNA